jgi:cytochrome P450
MAVAVLAFSPLPVLRAACAIAVLAVVWIAWRARPSYGRTRGLPPGSLLPFPTGLWRDQSHLERQAARFGPVFKMSSVTQPMICVVGLPKAMQLLRDHAADLGPTPLPFNRHVPKGFLRYMDPVAHRLYRASFRAAISRDVISSSRPIIEQEIRQRLARLATSEPARGEVAPRVHAPLVDMTLTLFIRLFVGVEQGTATFDQLAGQLRIIDFRREARRPRGAVRDALARAEAIVCDEMRRVRAASSGTAPVPRSFLAELVHADPAAADDPTAIRNLIYLLSVSAGDVAGLLVWTLKQLADNPEWLPRLRDETDTRPEAADRPDALPYRVILETLRLEQSELIMRRMSRDIRWNGFLLPKGWLLRVCIRECHRDPNVFEQPTLFDPDRFRTHQYRRADYSPFGASEVYCLGDHLTLSVGSAFVTELARGYDLARGGDGPPEYSGVHWQPNERFSVRLIPRRTTL